MIHTVGPQDEHPGALKRCYKRTLDIVKENKLKSVVRKTHQEKSRKKTLEHLGRPLLGMTEYLSHQLDHWKKNSRPFVVFRRESMATTTKRRPRWLSRLCVNGLTRTKTLARKYDLARPINYVRLGYDFYRRVILTVVGCAFGRWIVSFFAFSCRRTLIST